MLAYFQGLSPFAIFGILSAVLSCIAYIPYMIDTIRGETQPQRTTWLIWSVLSCIALMAQIFEGAGASLWFAGAQVSGTVSIFVLSLFFGTGSFLSRRDGMVLILAAGGLVAWYYTDTAAYALAITISISMMGGLITVAKAYRAPSSETNITWLLSGIASFFALLAVGKMDIVLMAYPLYLLTLNTLIVLASTIGQNRPSATDWHGAQHG